MTHPKKLKGLILIIIPLLFTGCPANESKTWDLGEARKNIEEVIVLGEQVLALGIEGDLEKMSIQAKTMIQAARTAIRALPPQSSEGKKAIRHLKVVLDEAESVIVHGRKGHQEDCILHAQNALDRAKMAKENAKAI